MTGDGVSLIYANADKNKKDIFTSWETAYENEKKTILELLALEKTLKFDQNVEFSLIYFTASWCPPCVKFSP